MVQGLSLCASTAGRTDLIPGPGTKILHAVLCRQEKEKNASLPVSTIILRIHDSLSLVLPWDFLLLIWSSPPLYHKGQRRGSCQCQSTTGLFPSFNLSSFCFISHSHFFNCICLGQSWQVALCAMMGMFYSVPFNTVATSLTWLPSVWSMAHAAEDATF